MDNQTLDYLLSKMCIVTSEQLEDYSTEIQIALNYATVNYPEMKGYCISELDQTDRDTYLILFCPLDNNKDRGCFELEITNGKIANVYCYVLNSKGDLEQLQCNSIKEAVKKDEYLKGFTD